MKAPGKQGPQRAGMNDDRKPDSVKGSIKRLFAYISHEKAALFIVVICVILSSATALIGSYLLRPIVNTLSEDFKNIMILSNSEQYKEAFGMCITHLVTGIVKMAVVYAVGVIATYTQSRIMICISQRAILNIRNDLYNKIQSLPIRFFDERNTGEIMSRFTNDIDSVGEMLNNSITQLISGTITIVGTLALMIYTNWILTIITIVFIPLMLKAVATREAESFSGRSRQRSGRLTDI